VIERRRRPPIGFSITRVWPTIAFSPFILPQPRRVWRRAKVQSWSCRTRPSPSTAARCPAGSSHQDLNSRRYKAGHPNVQSTHTRKAAGLARARGRGGHYDVVAW